MHRRVVQRILSSGDTQEAGGLLEGFGSHTWHVEQFPPRAERPVLRAVVDDVLCQSRSQTGYVCEQMLACGVYVYANEVHAALHCPVEALLQCRLIYIVLVLSHADALRVYLHQLCQRVHQSPADADGATDGNIVVRKLLPRQFRR